MIHKEALLLLAAFSSVPSITGDCKAKPLYFLKLEPFGLIANMISQYRGQPVSYGQNTTGHKCV